VAHELNQPLGAILNNAEAAEIFLDADPPRMDEVRQILSDIRRDDWRAGEIIRGMRSLLSKHEPTPEPISINEPVEDVLKLLRADASARKVRISFSGTQNLPPVWGDWVHLQQVVLNLVLNAMEALAAVPEEKRRIIVRTGQNNGIVNVDVADSGPGIPTETLSKLFEPFYTTKKDGMGIGLSIARTIIESYKGRIWAENNLTAGATFHVTLPTSQEL
jgi:C4-dicarboxylate-specific signal transduction histidine kinase